jgi:integrase
VTQFLERQKSKVALGKISAGRFDTLQRNAHHFAKFVGGTTGINSITGLTLVSYHDHLAQEKEANDWTWVYTEMFMRVARQFVQWCNDVDLMDRLPKNLNKEELRFAVPKPKINTFPIDEIKILLANAVDRTKLFLLLMMNTGMQQKDISDLTPDEVDWQTGRITRHRSKLKNGPVISYPLWSKTFELLKKLGTREGDRVLTNEKGLQLKIEELVDGKLRKVDNVAVAYHRLFVKCSSGEKPLLKTKRPLKLLRKTSPSLLNTNIKYKSCAIMFLADSVRGIQPTHYIAPDQATFDEAVLWLGQQYGEG